MKAFHQDSEWMQSELIADLQEEAATLQRRARMLEIEVNSLRRDYRKARRNFGYRLVNGVSRGLKGLAGLIHQNGMPKAVPFPRPAGPARNGSAPRPFSRELKRLLQTLPSATRFTFFTNATHHSWALHKALAQRSNRHLCFTEKQLKVAMADQFFAVPKAAVSSKAPVAFAHHDLIVIDCADPGALWPLLKGRFWPHQKVLLYGKAVPAEGRPHVTGPDFAFYAAPPISWLDPRHKYLPAFGPWKSAQRRLPASLPSGKPWPKISVVTPSFNQGCYIGHTFESVFGQNYPNLEYMLLDGGSTDDTRAILDRYRPRLAYSCSQKDNGQADAINKGFSRASGEILAWLNSDDQYGPDALMHVALAFDQFPEADIVVGGCGLLESTSSASNRVHHCALPVGKVVPLPVAQLLDVDNSWLKGDFFYQPEVFWRRRIWEAAGGRVADDLYYCFDYDLWVRMAQAGAQVVHIPDLLAVYRVHPAQKTYGASLPYLPELKLVQSRSGRRPLAHHDALAKA